MGIKKIGPNEFFIRARVKLRGHDPRRPVEDRRRQERFKGSRAQAEERYLQLKTELRGKPHFPEQQAKTFGDLLLRYQGYRGGEIPRSQRGVYKTLLRDLGPVDLRSLGRTLERYALLLRRTPSARTGRLLSPGAINRHRAMVSVTLRLAVDLGALERSPLNKAVWPKLKEVPRDRYLDDRDAQRLLEATERVAPHLRALVQFAILVPCRKSELVNMRREDLDLFNNAIRVRNGTTKNDDGSWKPIPAEMVPYFRSLPADCPWLFYRQLKKGGYRPLGDFKRAWDTALREAGITDFRFHDTRHISATNLVDAGTPERVVMAVAGWRTNMLSTYYKNLSKKALALVRFPTGSQPRDNDGGQDRSEAGKVGDCGAERAVS